MTARPLPLAAAAWAAALAAPALAQDAGGALPRQPVIPVALAVEAATAALEACAAQGWRVTVAVVDQGGVLRALLRGDGATPHTTDSSFKKAYTAASTRVPTLQYARLIAENPLAQGLRDMNENILILGGGLPIKVGEEVVGGIGVGGAPGGDKDETCAAAGVARIADRLR
jgi:uncharacterized protein GlcG (DUF336 family)